MNSTRGESKPAPEEDLMATQIRIRRRGRARMLVVAAVAVAGLVLPAGPVLAQADPYSGREPEVLPTRLQNEEPGTSPDAAGRSSDETLPATGAELTLFIVTGLAAVRTGATLVRRSR